MSGVFHGADRLASNLLMTVSSKTSEIWAFLHDGHAVWEALKDMSWFLGCALVGAPLFYVFFVINPEITWLEVIPAFVGMVLLAPPLLTLVFLSFLIVAGIAMIGGGILLKIIVIVGRLGRSARPPVRSEGERR